uniref:Uncharacterized protein n=1 Tax=Lotharella oceanica TaxID=641309 RepID=A0A7S2X6S5_9EUKA|mmetsp:Transcript_14906/g.28375  ORF Transcript_14906/g.28375 Transcript_14906/m.28375 type:complete len:124 (+) Transcript_14906:333-704(+)
MNQKHPRKNLLFAVMVFSSGVLVVLIEFTRKYFVDQRKSEKAKAEKQKAKGALEHRFVTIETELKRIHETQRRHEELLKFIVHARMADERRKTREESRSYWSWLAAPVFGDSISPQQKGDQQQ